ncbi:hypothetical protein QKU58_gp164 [Pyramimonas orientalis virus]|uniref:Uncharacterized protein n=1 Tax=Pyramimonas orientalis virus 01B TaxID=3134525 RepID=A0A7M4CER1_9VIRU|nr:hypothetical protein QKU58_gp164 [Pyramimonas orientalis virus]QOI90167.1 hypothetical protein HWQ62_00030 [Pyramimonas orientalis virus]
MLVYLIQTILIFLSFGFIYFNHKRISNIQINNEALILDTKKKINALNTVLLQKYEQKQNIDSKIMKILINKMNALSSNMTVKDESLINEIDSVKSTLRYLREQNTLFNRFDEESV